MGGEFLVLMIEKHWSKVNFSSLGEFLSNYRFFNEGFPFFLGCYQTLVWGKMSEILAITYVENSENPLHVLIFSYPPTPSPSPPPGKWSKVNFSGLEEFLSNYHFFNEGFPFFLGCYQTPVWGKMSENPRHNISYNLCIKFCEPPPPPEIPQEITIDITYVLIFSYPSLPPPGKSLLFWRSFHFS